MVPIALAKLPVAAPGQVINAVTLKPVDSFQKRVFLEPLGVLLEAEGSQITQVTLDMTTRRVNISLTPSLPDAQPTCQLRWQHTALKTRPLASTLQRTICSQPDLSRDWMKMSDVDAGDSWHWAVLLGRALQWLRGSGSDGHAQCLWKRLYGTVWAWNLHGSGRQDHPIIQSQPVDEAGTHIAACGTTCPAWILLQW